VLEEMARASLCFYSALVRIMQGDLGMNVRIMDGVLIIRKLFRK
jgi:hypothetical protein